jgi:hypothetical protein
MPMVRPSFLQSKEDDIHNFGDWKRENPTNGGTSINGETSIIHTDFKLIRRHAISLPMGVSSKVMRILKSSCKTFTEMCFMASTLYAFDVSSVCCGPYCKILLYDNYDAQHTVQNRFHEVTM